MAEFNRRHRIQGRLVEGSNGKLPPIPEPLKEQLTIQQNGDHLQADVSGELADVLDWLAQVRLREVTVRPVGLQSIYERFHFAEQKPTATDSGEAEVAE